MTTNNESKLSLELAWAKVLLKFCLDVLETHNEPIVKRLRNDVSDFLKDDYNLLKNQKKINISEGNVKENDINVANNVAQRNLQDLTELWKNGELAEGWYYIRNKAHSIKFNQMSFYMVYGEVSYWINCKEEDIEKVLAPVPSFEQWQPFTDPYFKGLTTKDIAELAKKSIRLTKQHCKDNEEIEILREQLDLKNDMVDKLIRENEKLKELLKECKNLINECIRGEYKNELCERIDEVLK